MSINFPLLLVIAVAVCGVLALIDLVLLAPHNAIDRRKRVPIAETDDGDIATIEAEVDGHIAAYRNLPHRIRLRDETGFLSVAYFRGHEEMLKRMWPVGQTRLVSGKITMSNHLLRSDCFARGFWLKRGAGA